MQAQTQKTDLQPTTPQPQRVYGGALMKALVRLALIGSVAAATAGAVEVATGKPALQAKLEALKARGLDYSGALAFWPLGDGEGMLCKAYGTIGAQNPYELAT